MFEFIVEIEVPSLPEDMQARDHNRCVKNALRQTLEEHHRKHTRRHFQMGNRGRYSHRPRSAAWQKRKARQVGHQIDLLFSGESRDYIARQAIQVRIGGAAIGGRRGITASYRLRWPFQGAADLARELERWASDESRWASARFLELYHDQVRTKRSRRKRIRSRRH